MLLAIASNILYLCYLRLVLWSRVTYYIILYYIGSTQLHHVIFIWHHFCSLETLKTLFRLFFLLCSACTMILVLRRTFYRLAAWALRPVKLYWTWCYKINRTKWTCLFCCKVYSSVSVSVQCVQSQARGRDRGIYIESERDRLCFQWPTETFDCFWSQTVSFSELYDWSDSFTDS